LEVEKLFSSTIKKLVSGNDFHCVLPYPAVTDEVAREEIRAIEIVDPCPVLDISTMMSKNTRSAYSLHSIESILHQQLTAMIEIRFWKGVEDVYIDEEGQSESN